MYDGAVTRELVGAEITEHALIAAPQHRLRRSIKCTGERAGA
jgi:hypothetical protein